MCTFLTVHVEFLHHRFAQSILDTELHNGHVNTRERGGLKGESGISSCTLEQGNWEG